MLAYPKTDEDYVLETDASLHGLGAVLSQRQEEDQKLHPVAYASQALSQTERNYGVTELQTLAVVWAVSHFHHLLYGRTVTILTDHTAVKAVLECPNPTAKHARWWTRVYGRGIKQVKLCYRAGKENKGADALSRISHTTSPEVGTVDGEIQVATVTAPDILIDPHTDRVVEVQVTTVTVSNIPIDRPHTERVAISPWGSQTSEPESTRSHPDTTILHYRHANVMSPECGFAVWRRCH